VSHQNIWRRTGLLEKIVAFSEILPKEIPLGIPVSFHVFVRHPEGENVNPEERLSIAQGCVGQGIDLFDFPVGHSETADGHDTAMDHYSTTSSPERLIICIRITKIK
jgi:hypothetical protein